MAASCTFDEILTTPQQSTDDSQISFSTGVESTRAAEADLSALQGYGFSISAYLDGEDYDFFHYFDGEVTYNSSGAWVCDNPQYWPVTGSIIFDAYAYDSSVLETGEGSILKNNRTIDYTCSPYVDEQIDLLAISTEVENKQTAALNFKHALSQINFTVDFSATSETNVTLTKINVMYHNIVGEGTYTFGSDGDAEGTTAGIGVWMLGTSTLGDGYAATAVEMDGDSQTQTGSSIFFAPTDALMIIPQGVNITESTDDVDSYLSVSVEYSLNTGDDNSTAVATGAMELPAPTETNDYYEMGKAYTYNIVVNGKLISLELSVDDAEPPIYAYGNIDLGLITQRMTYDDYVSAITGYASSIEDPDEEDDGSHYYFTSAVRVAELLSDGVRDFVVVGSFGATDASSSDGKLGYYGSTSSPFYIAANSLGMMPNHELETEGSVENMVFETPSTENLFSIDLRGVYDFPTFGSSHEVDDTTLDTDAPILTAGIFKDLPLLDEVTFPLGLLAIGDYAFQNCISLASVDLAEVVHIEEGAFVDCIGLEEVLNGAITRVHAYGFDDCEKLKSIDLSKLVEVNESGFVECVSLGAVNLSNLVTVDHYAFGGCESMTLIDPDMTALSTVGSCAFQDCASLGMVEFGSQSLISIGDHAFSGCTSMYFQSSPLVLEALNSIGSYAFQGCETIGAIQFPKVTTVENGAFIGCTNVELTGDLTDLISIGSYAFQECKMIGTVDLEEITWIGSYAFNTCERLKLGSNDDLSALTTIEKHAFQGCISLDNDNLNLDNVIIIDSYGFEDCTSLVGVSLVAVESIGNYAFSSCSSLSSDLVLDKLKTLGNYAFSGCESITHLELNELTSLGGNAISGCSSLETVKLPLITENGITWTVTADDGTVSYPYTTLIDMLEGAKSTLKYLDLRGLTGAFTGWKLNDGVLEEVNIASVETLGGGAFSGCANLTSIDISSATTIEGYAFQNCTSLSSIDAPLVTTVGAYTFSGCPLSELSLPELTTWGGNFISGCYSLTSLELPLISDFTVTEDEDDYTISGMLIDWDQDNRNTTLGYVDLSAVESLPGSAFYDFVGLKVALFSSATSIGGSSFYNCTGLRLLDLRNLSGYETTNYAFSKASTSSCTLILSAEEYENVTGGVWWGGCEWKEIVKYDDTLDIDSYISAALAE